MLPASVRAANLSSECSSQGRMMHSSVLVPLIIYFESSYSSPSQHLFQFLGSAYLLVQFIGRLAETTTLTLTVGDYKTDSLPQSILIIDSSNFYQCKIVVS